MNFVVFFVKKHSRYFVIICIILASLFQESFAQNKKFSIELNGIKQTSDLNLFTHFILENRDLIDYYMPTRYDKSSYNYEINLKKPVSEFLRFLLIPKANFFLESSLVPPDLIEITFYQANTTSLNYIIPFEDFSLEREIKRNLDNSQDYLNWIPDFREKENNNSLSTYNYIPYNKNIFATINGRGDKDFYAIDTNQKTQINLSIISLNQSDLKLVVRLFNEKFKILKAFRVNKIKEKVDINLPLKFKNKIIYIEVSDATNIKTDFINKILTNNYIFFVY